MIPSVSLLGEYYSLEAVCCSPLLWYKDKRLPFGNGFWGFVLHPGPLVEEQTLYLEAGKLGWCSWGSWFRVSRAGSQSGGQTFCFELERMSRVFVPTLQKKLQHFFCALYWQGSCFTFLKHRGFLDLPITNISNFSPVALAAALLSIFLYCSFLQNTFLQIDGKF